MSLRYLYISTFTFVLTYMIIIYDNLKILFLKNRRVSFIINDLMYLLLMIQFSLFILFVDQRSKSDEISGKIYLWTVHLFRRYKFQLVDTRARHFAISAFRKNDECWPCKVRLLSKKGTIRKRAKLYRATLTNPLTSYILFIIFTYCISKYVSLIGIIEREDNRR